MIDFQEMLFTASVVVPAVLVGVSVHESAHALSALWLGDDTAKLEGRITLNPVKHITWVTIVFAAASLLPGSGFFIPFKPVPINHVRFRDPAWDGALTAIAGPLSNLLLGLFVVLLGKGFMFLVPSLTMIDANVLETIVHWLLVFSIIQFSLFLFNMIPIPPLDGHWILGALIPPLDNVFEVLRSSMLGFLILLVVINVPGVRDTIYSFTLGWINMIRSFWMG